MASRRSRGLSRPTASQPYDTYSSRGKPFRPSAQFAPSFTNIEFEVVKEYQGDIRKPKWLISETGETYSFEVQRDGLRHEEVEVVFERVESSAPGRSASSCAKACANGGFPVQHAEQNGARGACGAGGEIPSADIDGKLCLERALLTIFCSRHCERSLLPAPRGADSFCGSGGSSCSSIHSSISNPWRFGCRFKLPFDASPERATAAHSVGSLTVTVPRLSWSSPWLRVPHIRWGAWSMQIASTPPQHQALDAADNAALFAGRFGRDCSCSISSCGGTGSYGSQGSVSGTAGSSVTGGSALPCVAGRIFSPPQPSTACGGACSSASSSGESGGRGTWGAAEGWMGAGGAGSSESASGETGGRGMWGGAGEGRGTGEFYQLQSGLQQPSQNRWSPEAARTTTSFESGGDDDCMEM
ncbi:hypothetical protein CLOM_g5772 [Closterium sp. NIES-68]|nr:hypothetical protein CLOM_g5772 [Closterium sp. NIES-68]GJP73823.1 hypothetical protein CLOP_g4503 [Closterium sp. NIES-67]